MPEPGWIPPSLGVDNECLRQAFACITGIHPIRLEFIKPGQRRFPEEWGKQAERHGYTFVVTTVKEAEARSKYWIAVAPCIPDRPGWFHAVVMRGSRYHYDWGNQRCMRPRKIDHAMLIERLL